MQHLVLTHEISSKTSEGIAAALHDFQAEHGVAASSIINIVPEWNAYSGKYRIFVFYRHNIESLPAEQLS